MPRSRLSSSALLFALIALACGEPDHTTAPPPPPPPPAPGRVVVNATTTGTDRDIAYIAVIDSGPGNLLLANGAVRIDSVSPGRHALHIYGVAPNCTLSVAANQSITVSSGDSSVTSFTATCTAATRQIMFGSNRDGNYDLYVMNPDGSNVVRVTTDTAWTGSWSPDGTHLLYMSNRSGVDQIYVSNADGSAPRQLTTDAGNHEFPAWSPDGRRIAYVESYVLWVMDADGGNPKAIGPSNSGWTTMSWSPDGNRIAFAGSDSLSTSQVFSVKVDGSDLRQLTHFPRSSQSVFTVAWSPDGTKIAFNWDPNSIFDLYVMNADGSQVTQLTHGVGGYTNDQPAWSPDGTQIAFHSTRDGGHPEIYTMSADGTSQVNVSQNVWDNYGPAWHP